MVEDYLEYLKKEYNPNDFAFDVCFEGRQWRRIQLFAGQQPNKVGTGIGCSGTAPWKIRSAFGSGVAAIDAVLRLLKTGDEVIAAADML